MRDWPYLSWLPPLPFFEVSLHLQDRDDSIHIHYLACSLEASNTKRKGCTPLRAAMSRASLHLSEVRARMLQRPCHSHQHHFQHFSSRHEMSPAVSAARFLPHRILRMSSACPHPHPALALPSCSASLSSSSRSRSLGPKRLRQIRIRNKLHGFMPFLSLSLSLSLAVLVTS